MVAQAMKSGLRWQRTGDWGTRKVPAQHSDYVFVLYRRK